MVLQPCGLYSGAGDRNRTGDLRVTSALLYQLSYAGESLKDEIIASIALFSSCTEIFILKGCALE